MRSHVNAVLILKSCTFTDGLPDYGVAGRPVCGQGPDQRPGTDGASAWHTRGSRTGRCHPAVTAANEARHGTRPHLGVVETIVHGRQYNLPWADAGFWKGVGCQTYLVSTQRGGGVGQGGAALVPMLKSLHIL